MPQNSKRNLEQQEKRKNQETKPQTLKEKFFDFYYSIIPYFILNLCWVVLSLPIVTFLPALGGLYHATLLLADNGHATWGDVWYGFKKYFWLSMKWGILLLMGIVILSGNVWFYLTLTQDWRVFPLVFSFLLLILWVAINQFSFPMLLLQEDNKYLLALRNCHILMIKQPFLVIRTMFISMLIIIVSIVIPPVVFFVSIALICFIQNHAVLNGIKEIQQY